MDNEKKPCCCCGTPAQPEAATAPAADASAVPTESVTPSCCRHKDRTPEEHKALLNRLSRIEGQVRGIRGMLEKDAYCVDILVQVAAANSALNSFSKELLAQHISHLRGGRPARGQRGKAGRAGESAAQAHEIRSPFPCILNVGVIFYGTIQRYRHELRSLQRPGGEGREQGARRHQPVRSAC